MLLSAFILRSYSSGVVHDLSLSFLAAKIKLAGTTGGCKPESCRLER